MWRKELPKLPKLPVDNTMPPVWLNWFNAVYNASLQNPNIFNVLSYGAKGDGTTDDSRGFQSAINAATIAGNGIVYAPDTNNGYAFGSAVKLPSNVLLLGDNKKGLELSRIKPTPGYTGNLVESIGWSATAANATKIQNSGIVGFFFDGSSTTLTAVDTYCQECVFLDNTFKNMYTYGMRIAGKSSATNDLGLNNNIHHNYFSKVGSTKFWDAIFEDYYTADNKYTNNYIEGCQNASIETRGANSLITENHLFDTKHHILSLDSVEKQITDNYLEFCTHSSIRVENGSDIYRIFCFFDKGNIIILLNGFQKKDQKTPQREIELAQKLKNKKINNNFLKLF